jgi:hypothetical protein
LAARTGWDRKPWLKKNPYPQLKIMAVVAARRQRLSILAAQAIEILQKEKLLMRVDVPNELCCSRNLQATPSIKKAGIGKGWED